MIRDVIYGDLYDEFSKYFMPNEENHSANQDNIITTPLYEFKMNLQTDQKPIHTTTIKTLSLRKGKPPGGSDYETDNDASQNVYSDNYEKSSEKGQGLSNEASRSTKIGMKIKENGHETQWSLNSESDTNKRISDESTDYSKEIKEFFATNRENFNKNNSYKIRGTGDDTRSILRNGKEKKRPKVMKHDQFSEHASSVLDEGKSLATKTVFIDFEKTDLQVNPDKHKSKKSKFKAGSKTRKDALRSDKTISHSFYLQI